MLGTRHEEYRGFINGIPFVFNNDIKRTYFNCSKENNWHENLEIQICTDGEGTVILDGERYEFKPNDIAVVNSNVLHYTGTDTNLTYSCLIISTEFCKQMGFDTKNTVFLPLVKSEKLVNLFGELAEIYCNENTSCRIAKLNQVVLNILIELAEKHSIAKAGETNKTQKFETVKLAIEYIRDNFSKKLTLEEIATTVLCDKYELCREFKKLTGQTIFENINNYRCIKAIDYLSSGHTVSESAFLCGFENLSFFTKIFKKYTGNLPSFYKK